MIVEKKNSLIEYSIRTFQNSNLGDVQTNARKATEAFCKYIILHAFGEERGHDIIFSKDEEYNKRLKVSSYQKNNEQEFVLSMLVKVIFSKSEVLQSFYAKKNSDIKLRKITQANSIYLKRYLDVLVFNGNASSHETKYITLNRVDVVIVQEILKKLLFWLFTEYLEEDIPHELETYLTVYDVFLSYRHVDDLWIEALKTNLEKQKYKVFLDKYGLVGGESIQKRLKNAINNSKNALIILSKESLDSEWMKKEYGWMKERKLVDSSFNVIPVFIEGYVSSPFEDVLGIDFSKDSYEKSFFNLICALEGKSSGSRVEILDRLEVPLCEVRKTKAENKNLKIDENIVNKLLAGLDKEFPSIIEHSQKENIDKEIEFLLERVRSKYDYIYCLKSPKIKELSYAKKILLEGGIIENNEQRYVKDLVIQSKFYQNTQTFMEINDWIDILKGQVSQDEKLFIIFQLDNEDRFYKEVFSELNNILINYLKNLKIIIFTESKQKNILNNNIFKK